MKLAPAEQKTLMSLAREAIRLAVSGGAPDASWKNQITGGLKERCAVFVSIYKENALRGSMGYALPVLPLWKAVGECAIYAAFRDPRFSPLTADELDAATLEITVVTAIEPVEQSADLSSGARGIMLKRGFRQAAMLPHDLKTGAWSTSNALARLSRQIGPIEEGDAERDMLKIFSAEVYRES